jgi:hypothetical protein
VSSFRPSPSDGTHPIRRQTSSQPRRRELYHAYSLPVAAFINEVQAFLRSGRLDAATADSLIAQAQAVTSGI